MDVDENPNTARAFGIMSIPTLLFKKKDGQVVKQVAGVPQQNKSKAIVAELTNQTRDQVLALVSFFLPFAIFQKYARLYVEYYDVLGHAIAKKTLTWYF